MAAAVVLLSLAAVIFFPVVVTGADVNPVLKNGDVISEKEVQARVRRADDALKALNEVATARYLWQRTGECLGIMLLSLSACGTGICGALAMRSRRMRVLIALVPMLLVASIGVVLVYIGAR
ncbi:MAG: hypothetical protein KIS62_07515 [Ramlibacter sp.]|nr:hypothetical protein [Ramlibacter sp.]